MENWRPILKRVIEEINGESDEERFRREYAEIISDYEKLSELIAANHSCGLFSRSADDECIRSAQTSAAEVCAETQRICAE